jgi:biotin carboxyl carrier protein
MNSPRAKQFVNWKPEGYEKSIEEFRREIGPGLSDDELLLKILIPGKPVKRSEPKKPIAPSAIKAALPVRPPSDLPTEFTVDVDGEVFNVKISPVWDGARKTGRAAETENPETAKRPKELPSGALLCGMAGLILSIKVKVGDPVNRGDLVAMIEAMKMRREVRSPHDGVVKEIWAREGEMVNPEDLLMVVQSNGQ